MPKKEIQEPSLLTHRKEKPLQLVSFDIKKAFDKVGHSVIKQALQAFGLPETIVQALRQSPLVGFARVEINGRKGILMTIPILAQDRDGILFLLASEPLNRALVARHMDLMYLCDQ